MSWRNIILSSALSFIGVVFFGVSAHAATVDIVTIPVTGSDDEPLVGMVGELYTSGGDYANYGTVNESGNLVFYSVEDGTYSLHLEPSMAWECSDCSIYESMEVDVTVDLDLATFDEAFSSYIQTLETIQMEQADTILTVTVVDQDDTPAAEVWVSGWSYSGNGDGWFNIQTDETGVARTAIEQTGTWSINTWAEGYSSAYEDGVVIEEGENELTIEVQSFDATINAQLVDSEGAAYNIGAEAWGSVSCFNDDWSIYGWGDISSGGSTATIQVVGGETYRCSTWLDGAATREVTVAVAEDGEEDIEIEVLSYDADVNIELVAEGTDTVLSDVETFDYYTYSVLDENGVEYYNDYHWGQGENGEAATTALDGVTYQAGVWIPNDSGSVSGGGDDDGLSSASTSGRSAMGLYSATSGTQYVQNYEMLEFVADESEAQLVQVELQEADATIEVTVTGSEGAWVSANEITTDGSWGTYIGNSTENGVATLAVVSGKTYEIYAYPWDAWGGDKMPPKMQTVTPDEGETVELTMATQIVDYTINLSVAIDEGDAESLGIASALPDYVWCYAFNDEGVQNYADLIDGIGDMGWLSESQAHIGCMGYSGNSFLRTRGETVVTTGDSGDSSDIELTLGEYGEFYEEQTYTFDSSSGATEIDLEDGSSVTFPQGLSDGNVTFTAGTSTDTTASDADYPVESWDFELRDDEGELIEDFDKNVTIRMKYDEELLDELGVDEEKLTGGSKGDNNEWTSPASVDVDTEDNTIVISASHFSTYAALGDLRERSVDEVGDTKEELGEVVSIERGEDQTVTVEYANGDTKSFRVFPNGTAKAKAQLHTNGDVLIAINKKFLRTLDVYSGEEIDQVKLFKKKQNQTKFKRLNVYKKNQKNNILVLARTKKAQKKQFKLRSFVVKNNGDIVRKNVQRIELEKGVKNLSKLNVKKNKKNGLQARVMLKRNGKNAPGYTYKLNKKNQLVTVE